MTHITPGSIVEHFQIPLTALRESDLFKLWWEKDDLHLICKNPVLLTQLNMCNIIFM